MATEVGTSAGQSAPLAPYVQVDAYVQWQQDEGVPVFGGFYIEDLNAVEVAPWPRKGVKGAIVNLEGTGGVNDAHVVEIAPGGATEPERHLYEELVYVVSGRGTTTVWYEGKPKQTFEWGKGSLFSIPLNAWFQHFNGSGSEPARYLAVTNLPTAMRQYHNREFIFANPFAFVDRFAGDAGYFSGEGELFRNRTQFILETNFVPDVHSMRLHSWAERGGGGSNVMIELAQNTMSAHVSEFAVGMYKKAHHHGPGAHVVILGGTGYSLLWSPGQSEPQKCDWHPGSVIVPPEHWFHQHFNTGPAPARYLALKFQGRKFRQAATYESGTGADVSVKDGGWQIEYEDEERTIHELFEREVARHGAPCRMKAYIPWCTGEVGPTLPAGGD
jgi:quercetin dioxygenase-like cupin family protein